MPYCGPQLWYITELPLAYMPSYMCMVIAVLPFASQNTLHLYVALVRALRAIYAA